MVELVDALDSKSSESNLVRVRFPPSVQEPELKNSGFFASKNNLTTTKTSSNYQKEAPQYFELLSAVFAFYSESHDFKLEKNCLYKLI